MIRFSLHCDKEHSFEAWFSNSKDFETQKKRGFVVCPECGSSRVEKALMAPGVAGTRKSEERKVPVASPEAPPEKMLEMMRAVRNHVVENSDYVGDRFAEEARKIHYGETEMRGIYGETTADDARELADEGVAFFPLPQLPEDRN